MAYVKTNTTTLQKSSEFSVVLNGENLTVPRFHKFSLTYSAKPLMYFASIFGLQMIKYSKGNVHKVTLNGKLVCLLVVTAIISSIVYVQPKSWKDTKTDIPLNILTKSYTMFHSIEVIFAIIAVSFLNNHNYMDMFKVLDSTDSHINISKRKYRKRFYLSIALIVLPLLQTCFTFWLRKFNVNNLGAHFTFFIAMLQGAIIIFFTINIYLKQTWFNQLLIMKTKTTDEHNDIRTLLLQRSLFNQILKILFKESFLLNTRRRYCWFEIMQIYDKLADCIYAFNKIYSTQVLIMFSSWLLCTLLIICRSLSPSVKYSEIILSDIFTYCSLNVRPIFLTTMCEMFIQERKKTLFILKNYLAIGDLDTEYFEQVETMIDLVETRRLKISGNVFTVDATTMMNFSGRVISYAVLMIQYFYMHVSVKK